LPRKFRVCCYSKMAAILDFCCNILHGEGTVCHLGLHLVVVSEKKMIANFSWLLALGEEWSLWD